MSYLLGNVKIDFDFIYKNINLNKEEILEKVLNRYDNLKVKDLENEVLPFLIKTDDVVRIRGFGDLMRQIKNQL